MIRRALTRDVAAISRLINDAAEYGLMLHRSNAELYENVRDFCVAEDNATGAVVGVCGLRVMWANIAEVYALVVAPSARGRGLGKQLVRACIEDARGIGVRKLMALTYEQPFFEKLGFAVVDRQKLPLKVWSECLRCAKNTQCDEIAMLCVLEDVPEVEAPKAPAAVAPYQVPVQLQIDAPQRRLQRREKMDELKK